MEILVILLFIVLIILIITLKSRVTEKMNDLQREIARLREEIKLKEIVREAPAKEEMKVTPPVRPMPPMETEPFVPKKPAPREFQPKDVQTGESRPAAFQPDREVTEPHVFKPLSAKPPVAEKKEPAPPRPGFFERHPDLEKFIGENLVSKIGIAILVLAIGFFVKYAIDNDWIGPVGRVGIGVLCGGILIGIAHFLRNSYKAFSSVLVGGGLAVLYFSIALAFHEYQLFSQTVAFIIMLVITAFAVILSLLYDRQELAIIALAGGFVTPFLVSNGSGNYKVLFTYLLILITGLLVMAYRKAWRLLNILSFGFTVILFISWLATLPDNTGASTYEGAFMFATAFYLLFFAINIAYNVREGKRFIASDFGILLVNTGLYFGGGLYLLHMMGAERYQGLFSACMAVLNLVMSYFLFRKKAADTNILYLLIGITLTFISLTAPIQLHGHYITLFWASESVLLYWLFQKSGIKIIRWASFGVWVAMLVSLVIDWWGTYFFRIKQFPLPIVFNKGMMTSLYAAACCFLLFRLRKKAMFVVAGSLLLLIGGLYEMQYQFRHYYPGTELSTLYMLLYGFAWSVGISYADRRWNWMGNPVYTMVLLGLTLFSYLVYIPEVYELQTVHMTKALGPHFWAHWVTAALVASIIYRCVAWFRRGQLQALPPAAFSWMSCIYIVIFLSAEGQLAVNTLFYGKAYSFDTIHTVYIRAGLPILWGLCSFIFMWMGMRYKFRPLRIISLALFSVTLLKLFLYDIQDIPVAGKIAAFFCLGVILLIVSFMYQRLKKIIIEDEEKKTS